MYEYKVNSEPFSPMTDIDDGDDAALIEILRWVYNAQVFMDSDRRITWQEELHYIVRGHDVEKKKMWGMPSSGVPRLECLIFEIKLTKRLNSV